MNTITFLLPISGRFPAGGLKVVYEYANRFASDGYKVRIVYSSSVFFSSKTLKGKCKSILRYFYYRIGGYKCCKWFNLNKNISEILAPSLNYKHVPRSDYYIATSVETAYYVNDYKINSDNKLYLIQDYENWNRSDDFVKKSYLFGLKNIVISNWLKKIVVNTGGECTLIPNGFDFNYFKKYIPIDERDSLTISMLYHKDMRKGCKYGIEALKIVKGEYPNLKATLFGVPERPKDLPSWIRYYQQPTQHEHNEIYNKSAIFLAPSIVEGWGLTVGEAMICGAAVVCSDAQGFMEMVTNGITGLVSKTRDAISLANNIIRLIEDINLRINIAEAGERSIHNYNWENSYDKFKNLIS